jgi:hypothetical protein
MTPGQPKQPANPAPSKGGGIQAVPKYSSIPAILIRQARKRETWNEWIRNAWKDEGLFRRYLAMEKATTERRLRQVGRAMQGFQQNNKSEHKLRACVPLREYLRFKAMDRDFWADDSNLRSLKRDNPNMLIN